MLKKAKRPTQAKPHYKHDCEACKFLGHVYYPGPLSTGKAPLRHADLYYCPNAMGSAQFGGTVIARSSSKGSDYSSVPVNILEDHYLKMSQQDHFSTNAPAMIAAYYFAKAAGYLKRK